MNDYLFEHVYDVHFLKSILFLLVKVLKAPKAANDD
jgi:hypothetical protein